MSKRRLHRVAAAGIATIAAAGMLAGCGSSSKTPSAAAGADTTTAATTTGTDTATDTGSPTTGDDGAAGDSKGGSASGSTFCQLMATGLDDDTDVIGSGDETPDQVKADVKKIRAEEEAIVKAAPTELTSDIGVLFAATDKLFAALDKVGYDYTKLDPTAFASVDTAGVTAAEAHLESYVSDKCGIDEGDDSGDASSPAAS